MWNPESGESLLVDSGIRRIFACGIRNPGDLCLWNPGSGGSLLVESGIRGMLACGIQNSEDFCLWNPQSGILGSKSVIQLKKSEIPLMTGIQSRNSADKESGIQYPESGIDSVESRIQDCIVLPDMVRVMT